MTTVSALFVDYDNIHISLGNIDQRLATIFERRPLDWMSIIQNADVEGEAITRNFAIRRCYANPDHMGRSRINYTQSAFEVVDCPALTQRGKNSADIYMVMDIMDTLSYYPHVEEFVIMSADSDFAPVITRLRKHLKRTVIYGNQNTARSYRNSCDLVINESDFIELLADFIPASPAPSKSTPSPAQAASPRQTQVPKTPALSAEITSVQEALRAFIFEQRSPVHFSNAANVLRDQFGEEFSRKWGGFNTFAKLVKAIDLSGVGMDLDSGGVFFVEERMNDPSYRIGQTIAVDEFIEAQGIDPALASFASQVGTVTGVPRLLLATYSLLFASMEAALTKSSGPNLELTRNILAEFAQRGKIVDKASILFVVRGIFLRGHKASPGDKADELAQVFLAQVQDLCASAGLQISEDENTLLQAWIWQRGIEVSSLKLDRQ